MLFPAGPYTLRLGTSTATATDPDPDLGGEEELTQYLNVKDFGALGDNSTDDYAAIQACFDAAWGNSETPNSIGFRHLNKQVFFPAGRYKVSKTLQTTYTYGMVVRGAGKYCSTIIFTGNVPPTFNPTITVSTSTVNLTSHGYSNGDFVNLYSGQDPGDPNYDVGRQGGLPSRTFDSINTSTNTFTMSSHGFVAGDFIYLLTGDFGGLARCARYYIIASGLTTNTFKVSTTLGGTEADITGTPGNIWIGIPQGLPLYVVNKTTHTFQLSATLGGAPLHMVGTTYSGISIYTSCLHTNGGIFMRWEGLSFDITGPSTVAFSWDWDNSTGPLSAVAAGAQFIHCSFGANSAPTTGLVAGASGFQGSEPVFYSCSFANCTFAGTNGANANALSIQYYGCDFKDCYYGSTGRPGAATEHMGCTFTNNLHGDIYCRSGNYGYAVGCRSTNSHADTGGSEHGPLFMDADNTSQCIACNVQRDDARVEFAKGYGTAVMLDGCVSNTQIVQGNFYLRGNRFGSGYLDHYTEGVTGNMKDGSPI